MSTGPGRRQRRLLAALAEHEAVLVVPPDVVNRTDATMWRRSARGLVRRGAARAIYVRRRDRAGRWVAHLVLTPPESTLPGNAFPARGPRWVDPSVDRLWESLGCRVQALLLENMTGQPVSPRTVARRAREFHDRAAA